MTTYLDWGFGVKRTSALMAASGFQTARITLILVSLLSGPVSGVAAQVRPATIPAMQHWAPGSGAYRLAPESRILVSDPSLLAIGHTFAQDLFDLTGKIFSIVTSSACQTGDICLDISPSVSQEEGYLIEIGSDVVITAGTSSGVFYGTRTLLQLLRQDLSVPAGIGEDWPLYAERGFMLDVGEKFFSVDFLKRHIRELAYLKVNYFHLHLSQDGGFRLESASHPEVVSAEHYTKAEIQELIDLAAEYHVTIIPEIDVPSHATAMLQNHPELQLPNHPEMLDLSKPGAYTLVEDLLEEYLPLFPSLYWHTGADEYLLNKDYALYPQYTSYAQQLYGPKANGQDLYVGFINWINGIVRRHNKILRAWNDLHGVTTVVNKPDKTIVLELFSANIGAANALGQGFKIMNCSPDPLYYVLGRSDLRADPVNLYDNWAPNLQFVLNESVPPRLPGLLGAKLHVWCDAPNAETADQIQQGIYAPLRSFGQNGWGSPKLFPEYNDFLTVINNIGRVSGWIPDFAALPSITAMSLASGQSGTFSVLTKANSSFSGTITVGCNTTAPEIVCNLPFHQFVLQPTQEQSISVSISDGVKIAVNPVYRWFSISGLSIFALCLSQSKRRMLGAAAMLCIFVVLSSGCGSSRKPPVVTMTFSSGAVVHSIVLNLTLDR